jgi:hypothetical protein
LRYPSLLALSLASEVDTDLALIAVVGAVSWSRLRAIHGEF